MGLVNRGGGTKPWNNWRKAEELEKEKSLSQLFTKSMHTILKNKKPECIEEIDLL